MTVQRSPQKEIQMKKSMSVKGCDGTSVEEDSVRDLKQNSEESISIVRPGDRWGGKLCKCAKCGITAICTPFFDFYRVHGDENDPEGAPLHCFRCMLIVYHERSKKTKTSFVKTNQIQ
jgi:hypothetical protein